MTQKTGLTFSSLTKTYMFSSPDGDDIQLKTLATTKNCLVAGAAGGLLLSRAPGMKTIMERVAVFTKITLSAGVMGASYAAGTQYIAQYRDADGPKNHFLGGLCMTPFFYPMSYDITRIKQRSLRLLSTVWIVATLASMFALLKHDKDNERDVNDTEEDYYRYSTRKMPYESIKPHSSTS